MLDNSRKQEILAKESPNFLSYSRLYFWWKKNRAICDIVRRELKGRNIKDILDLGCGRGDDIFSLDSNLSAKYNLTFTGIDKNRDNVEFANARKEYRGSKGINFYVDDATDLKIENGTYDLVISSEVIEHLTRPEELLSQIKRVLIKDGAAIITTPNKGNPMAALRKALRFLKPIIEDKAKVASENEHLSLKSFKEWIRLFKSAGFKVEKVKRGSLLFGGFQIDSPRILFLCALGLDLILDYIPFSANLAENNIFTLRKKDAED